MLGRVSIIFVVLLVLTVALVGTAFAADPHTGGATGQPSQSCQNPGTTTTPGHAADAPGSAFNPGGVAGGVYNETSQYDVACFQNSQPHP